MNITGNEKNECSTISTLASENNAQEHKGLENNKLKKNV